MDAAQISHALIEGPGYALMENVIATADAAAARREILDQVERQNQSEGPSYDGRAKKIGHEHVLLLDQGTVFEDLVQNPQILAAAGELLGEDFTLSAFSARVLLPGARPMGIHVDYPYWALPQPYAVTPPLMMQVIWMMQDFTIENGATFVAPHSQRRAAPPDRDRFKSEAIQITGRAGSAIVSHGLLWHDTAPNQTQEPRVAVLINYCNKVIRPMQDFSNIPEAVLARATPQLRRLLGKQFGKDLLRHLKPKPA
ncbi:MAG: phytanoyl-CoA dioxygenase family protein [Alphaproteobacteria bacterium]|nr:phytanoyl-CoA dioxygenase family protein [Alphaproteobacteria bacterium]